MLKTTLSLLIAVSLMTLIACNDDPADQTKEFGPQLENIAQDVILSTYEQLHHKTVSLATSLTVLHADQTAGNLALAREAWRSARQPWEQSEGFLFGPVDQQGIDPAIDSWPVNETDLDAVLNSSATLNKSYIDGLDGTLKGFHTLEYLLFGENGNKQITDFNARQFEYLMACSESLVGATTQLFESWNPADDNFIANIIDAGKSGQSIYPSQKSALQEIVNGMIVIADEVGNGKINDPFSQQDLTLEESRFSANSKQDFADNIRSIRNIYAGTYLNADGMGIANIVKEENAALDQEIQDQIDAAIVAIESIEGTFTTAIFQAPVSVQTAQTAVRDLQQLLESELLPLINNL